MKEIEEIYKDFSNGTAGTEQTVSRLMEYVFVNKNYIGFGWIDEDSFSEFLIFLHSKLEKILRNYNCHEDSFMTYFLTVLKNTMRYRIKQSYRKKDSEVCFDDISRLDYEEEKHRYECSESSLEVNAETDEHTLEELVKEELFLDDDTKSGQPIKYRLILSKKLQERKHRKMAVLILALKSCLYLNERMIDRVALITGIKRTELCRMLAKAHQSLEEKRESLYKLTLRRNSAFFFRRKYMLQKLKVRGDKYKCELLAKKIENKNSTWERSLEMLNKKKCFFSPSNKAIAQITGMDERQISYIIRRAAKNIDNLSLKWYSVPHENILGNRKSE